MNKQEIREELKKINKPSWTSSKFQDDIIDFIVNNKDKGKLIVEVGCALGGNTAQLLNVCAENSLRLCVLDINDNFIQTSKDTLEHFQYFGVRDAVDFIKMDLASYVKEFGTQDADISIIIHDADHRFEEVIKDMTAIYSLSKIPHCVALHDYSLRVFSGDFNPGEGRHIANIIAVKQAVHYIWGEEIKDSFGVGIDCSKTECYTIDKPNPINGSYFPLCGYEGIGISPLPIPLFLHNYTVEEYNNKIIELKQRGVKC